MYVEHVLKKRKKKEGHCCFTPRNILDPLPLWWNGWHICKPMSQLLVHVCATRDILIHCMLFPLVERLWTFQPMLSVKYTTWAVGSLKLSFCDRLTVPSRYFFSGIPDLKHNSWWCSVKCGMKLFIHSQNVWESISNFISYFTEHVITYPCWDWS